MRILFAFAVACCAALIFCDAATAADPQRLTVSRLGDVEKTCHELSQEGAYMNDIINGYQDVRDDSRMQTKGISAGTAAGSFLIGTLTGGISFAAAGFAMKENVEQKADHAENVQDVAEQRRSLMVGIFDAKGCYGPFAMVPESQRRQRYAAAGALNQMEPGGSGTPAGRTQKKTEDYNR